MPCAYVEVNEFEKGTYIVAISGDYNIEFSKFFPKVEKNNV